MSCALCGANVRRCIDRDGRRVLVNPTPEQAGNVWVVEYARKYPTVDVVGDPADVPAHEPLRYRIHNCEMPGV